MNNNRNSEYRKTTTTNEYKEKRKEKQDFIRQILKNQIIVEKRQKIQKQNEEHIQQLKDDITDNIKNELKKLHGQIKLQQQYFRKYSNYQKKQTLVSLRNLLSSNNLNIAIELLVNFNEQNNNNNNNNNDNKSSNNLFIDFLLKMLNDPMDDGNQLEAAWCITNIAGSEYTKSIINSTPFLINHLSSNNSTLQDQCAWALGNISLDSKEYRDLLIHQGILPPLVTLLSSRVPSLTITTCFTLSSLLIQPLPSPSILIKFFTNQNNNNNNSNILLQLNDQINFRNNRLNNKIKQPQQQEQEKQNENFIEIEILYHLLWLLNDFLVNISSIKPETIKFLTIDNSIFKTIMNFIIMNHIENPILLSPCIRILGWLVLEPILFTQVIQNENSNNNNNVIKEIISIIINNILLNEDINNHENNNNNNDFINQGLLNESMYLLSNLTAYSNQLNEINQIIIIENKFIDRFLSNTDQNENGILLREFIYLFSNLYFDKSSASMITKQPLLNSIIKNPFTLSIILNVIINYQQQNLLKPIQIINEENDGIDSDETFILIVCDFLNDYFQNLGNINHLNQLHINQISTIITNNQTLSSLSSTIQQPYNQLLFILTNLFNLKIIK
ncbi:hypothetical protein DDB_G0278973 [Dictyostelium discoideum AX4]|uniref:Uncharacterized protein n=1 Tax=Dictyostelium discoideum TaxID=44689 RepID=Q54XH0_DICDI|nr:hypothetical protein DDB_G0278973 [Dictyostelium discoideum AX4]EAL67908.1 hypothetical protein DDB_G0278973 [Dictyostelium discoideum AX4]|eukprot:XP_641879.1 hypothetical protein DDB_G0278973 [Dictyostelium discoideum AX4]